MLYCRLESENYLFIQNILKWILFCNFVFMFVARVSLEPMEPLKEGATGPMAAQKHQNFEIRDSIANISRWEQDIVDRKTALETAIPPLYVYQIW